MISGFLAFLGGRALDAALSPAGVILLALALAIVAAIAAVKRRPQLAILVAAAAALWVWGHVLVGVGTDRCRAEWAAAIAAERARNALTIAAAAEREAALEAAVAIRDATILQLEQDHEREVEAAQDFGQCRDSRRDVERLRDLIGRDWQRP